MCVSVVYMLGVCSKCDGHAVSAQHAVMDQCQGKKDSIISHGDQPLCELRKNRDVIIIIKYNVL